MTSLKIMTRLAFPIFALTLSGCNSKPATTAGTSAETPKAAAALPWKHFDPCSVLTAAEVTAISGDKVIRTEVNDHDCQYHTAYGEDGTVLQIYPTGGNEQMGYEHQAMSVLGGIGNVVAAQGGVGKDVQSAITAPGGGPAIGDDAMWEQYSLAVRKGDMFVKVTPTVVHDPTNRGPKRLSNRELELKLVQAVLAKLSQ